MNFFPVFFLFLPTLSQTPGVQASPSGSPFHQVASVLARQRPLNQAPGTSFLLIVISCLDQEHNCYALKELNLDLLSV